MCLCAVFVKLFLYVCVFVVNIYVLLMFYVIIDKPVHSCMINLL